MITIKTDNEIELMRQGGKILARIMKQLINEVKPGATTGQLEELADLLISQAGGQPSFKGYKSGRDLKPFPTVLCTSINQEVVHAPAKPARQLKSGDIVGIDIGMVYPNSQDGLYTDMAMTIGVGKISNEAQKLIATARQALGLAIELVKPNVSLNVIGKTIEQYVLSRGFSVVRDLVGHGVGRAVHEEPPVPNYSAASNEKIILKPGMTIAIEPMVNAAGWRIKGGADGFTILTADGGLSAHFEHTVAVMEDGVEVLTI